MSKLLLCARSIPLRLGGCAAKDPPDDGLPLTSAKTLGNIVPWMMLTTGVALIAATVGDER